MGPNPVNDPPPSPSAWIRGATQTSAVSRRLTSFAAFSSLHDSRYSWTMRSNTTLAMCVPPSPSAATVAASSAAAMRGFTITPAAKLDKRKSAGAVPPNGYR
eukprot:GHVU01231024.1.p1 GENE.GHVU01231024.1~~GHVU01231024.1.p1  ORF type:complete len:102 (+),score=13.66 GHVU01231024.1:225-530(+)